MLGTTFGGNPLARAAALAVLEVIENENLIENALGLGHFLISELRNLTGINEVRGRGLMIGIDLPEKYTALRNNLLFQAGIFTGEAKPNVIRLLFSLALKRQEAEQFLTSFKKLLAQ